jgi:hypothetical protein
MRSIEKAKIHYTEEERIAGHVLTEVDRHYC